MDPPALSRAQRRKVLLFAGTGNGLPIVVAVAAGGRDHLVVHLVGALLAVLAPVAVVLATRRRPLARFGFAMVGLPGLTALQAYEGGVASAYAALLVVPGIWFAIQASRTELVAGCVMTVACIFAPMLVLGAPAYPVAWPQAVVVLLVVGSVTGSLAVVSRETWQVADGLRRDATVDALTGLLNRRGWSDQAERLLARSHRDHKVAGVIALDLDRLKQINDTLGHDAGDRALRETAIRLRTVFRTQDVAARLGGDEFNVLLAGTSAAAALRAVERLRARTPARGAFSAGIAIAEPDEPLEDVVRRADLALYEAKACGGGTSVASEPIGPPDSAATSSPSTASTCTTSPDA